MRKTYKIPKILVLQITISAVLCFSAFGSLYGQNEAENTSKKERARISLEYTNINNNGPRLSASIKVKVERSYVSVPGVEVNFYIDSISNESKLGKAVTSEDGKAVYILPETLRKMMLKDQSFFFIAAIENNDKFHDADNDIEIYNSFIDVKFEEEDSVRILKVFFGTPDSMGAIVAVEDVEFKIYVERLFGLLPLLEDVEYTGENGQFVVAFPEDIPGDENGNLKVIVQTEEHELFGTVQSIKEIKWGTIPSLEYLEIKNTLWSTNANAPISLIITVTFLVLVIWGVIGYIIYLLFKIKKIGRSKFVIEN